MDSKSIGAILFFIWLFMIGIPMDGKWDTSYVK